MAVTSRSRRASASNLISTLTAIVVAIIVIGIVLVLLGANQNNMIVGWFHDAGNWLTTPFHGIFERHNVKTNVLLNWGLAAVVYAFVGGFLARLAPD
jgi:ABC-type uncharacterized transport system permease subunit